MPCYRPLDAWRGAVLPSGKRAVVFKAAACEPSLLPFRLKVPCGQCIGCRLERSRQWAIRCVHEASLYDRNCFVTLTFDNAHLPEDGSLSVRTFQLFMKRLRKAYPDERIRFFHCGEYGETLGRPHYHACLFNFDFPDKYLFSVKNGNRLYRSDSLERIWGLGFAMIGDVTFESAAYVARYVMKKVSGVEAPGHYGGKRPEYTTMSRRPGIGKDWLDKYLSDVYPLDRVVVRGREMRPPKFYDSRFEVISPDEFKTVKLARSARAVKLVPTWNKVLKKFQLLDDNRDERLSVKERVAQSAVGRLVRSLD